ncbi:MAG: hypothetical protein AABX33_07475 [Nanoarchaeota archaeon]
MHQSCHDGECSKWWGAKFIVVGAVVLATAVYFPKYIWHMIGILLIAKGILKSATPVSEQCQPSPMKKGKK